MNILAKLKSITPDKPKQIAKTTVSFDGQAYIIDGFGFSLEEAAEKLSQLVGGEYDNIAFLLVKPYTDTVVAHKKITTKAEYAELVKSARKRGLYIYRASVAYEDGKYYAKRPWIFEFDSIVEHEDKSGATTSLQCQYCGKSMLSKSGLTLHIKQIHGNQG